MKTILLYACIFFSVCGAQATAKQYTVVGTDLPPLMYQKDGQPMGFYVDVLQEMVKNTKDIDIKIEFYPAPRMFQVLSECTEAFSLGVTRNEKRENLYKWVGPIYPRVFSLFRLKSRTDLAIKKLEDVRTYTVGVGRGYAAVEDLRNAGIAPENIEQVTNDAQNVRKLFAKRIDFIVMNDVMLAYRLVQEGHSWDDIEQAVILNDTYQFWYAFNREMDDAVLQRLQNALDLLKQNGVYDTIVQQYFK